MKNYPLYPCKHYEDFKAFMDDTVRTHGSKPAISTFGADGAQTTRTYEKFASDVCAIAEALFDRGLAGKHIAVVSQNSYPSIVCVMAAAYAGGAAVPLDVEATPEAIKAMAVFADAA